LDSSRRDGFRMDITWYGRNCFRLMERGKGALVTDPFNASNGTNPRFRADIVTISGDVPGYSDLDAVKGATLTISRPGEFEVGGIFITGVAAFNREDPNPRRTIIYVFDLGNYTICHLGNLNYVPNQSQIEALGQVDVLMVPVGGGPGLSSGQAGAVISLIEPSIVIPMNYSTERTGNGLEPLDKFLKEMGTGHIEPEGLFRIGSSPTFEEETQIIVLEEQE